MNLYWIVAKEEYNNVAEIEQAYAEYTREFGNGGLYRPCTRFCVNAFSQ